MKVVSIMYRKYEKQVEGYLINFVDSKKKTTLSRTPSKKPVHDHHRGLAGSHLHTPLNTALGANGTLPGPGLHRQRPGGQDRTHQVWPVREVQREPLQRYQYRQRTHGTLEKGLGPGPAGGVLANR